MCGILGVLKLDGAPVDAGLLTRMRDTMFHRGPDDGGTWVSGSVGLAHRRLSILDLSPDGHQPMCNEDGTIWLVFNGEIYNYVELAARLRQQGHQFRSHTDTECIIHLYEELGERCVHELNGMFSFLLWDARRGQLFGARDRMGIKPFHYYVDPRQFICASEIKAIVEDPAVPRAPDRRGIADYLFAGAPLAGKTFFKEISELPPGHAITVRDGQVQVTQYWSVRYDYDERRSADVLVGDLTDLLDDAVRIHCRSDAALGSHLSGGLDSSTVASIASRHVDPLRTFSIRFDGGEPYDETRFARIVSGKAGTQHVERTAPPETLAHTFASLIWHMDQPPAGGSDAGYSYYAAAALAAEHVKVALTGHGGDEVFAGYGAQFAVAGIDMDQGIGAPASNRRSAGSRLVRVLQREGLLGVSRHLAGRFFPRAPRSPEDRWIQLHCSTRPARNPILGRAFRQWLGGYSPVEDYLAPFTNAPTDRLLDRALHHDLRVYLPQLLHKEDRASMAVSIESRVPLLDYRIIELMATVPPEQKVLGKQPKALLRRAAARWLPAEIAERRDKVPFALPIQDWVGTILAPLVRKVAMAPSCLERGIYDPDLIRRGRLDAGEMLKLVNLELWFRIYIDRDPLWRAEVGRASRPHGEPAAVAASPIVEAQPVA